MNYFPHEDILINVPMEQPEAKELSGKQGRGKRERERLYKRTAAACVSGWWCWRLTLARLTSQNITSPTLFIDQPNLVIQGSHLDALPLNYNTGTEQVGEDL